MNQKSGLFQATTAVLTLTPPVWRESATICALADEERHLGHAMRTGRRWHAFDATRSNDESTGFCPLGTFASVAAAKEAVEQSLRRAPTARAEAISGAVSGPGRI
jgi:L-amino acid N-acyltransferase YncA